MEDLLTKLLTDPHTILTAFGWILAAAGTLMTLLYKSIWKAINLASDGADNAHKEAHRLTDGVYTYLEDVRRLRDDQIAGIDRRLLILETEHRGCQQRLRQLEQDLDDEDDDV